MRRNAPKRAQSMSRPGLDLRIVLCGVLVAALGSCVVRNHPGSTTPPTSANDSFIDLQPGWRLRAIVPLLKSGKIEPPALTVTGADGLALTVKAGSDLIGYQTQYYVVEKRWPDVRVSFSSASNTVNGVSTERSQPVVNIFAGRQARRLRLLYLARVSRADHNMALLGARDPKSLADLTRALNADPTACTRVETGICVWVPPGIALRPELRRLENGVLEWQPAQ